MAGTFSQRGYQRAMKYPEMDVEEWYEFMQQVQPTEITWRCSWLDLADMAIHSDGFDRMVIVGLTRFTFYIPGRILRRLSISQGDVRIRAGVSVSLTSMLRLSADIKGAGALGFFKQNRRISPRG
jgi:hypothetical protein